ncbi:MAG: DUF11 domain-containing protein [Gammaproteobacteria bacterium]|nr:DUF11 domain-containing protein [Gammaproteobacteria bacterium]
MNLKHKVAALLWVLLWSWSSSITAVPVSFYQSLAGNYDFVVTGGSLRTSDANACLVTNSGSAPISGIPGSANIVAAYLYWAGSGSTPDYTVTFEGGSFSADRTFTESAGTRDWFAGFKDVTTIVQNKAGGPNGTYSFADLTVDTGGDHCSVATVLSGWGLAVIFEDSGEPLRVLNLYDGLQNFWGTDITLTPSNFRIPAGVDGRFSVLTWEGDIGNSTPLNGRNEDLRFNGTLLTDALNPAQNQYNSTINSLGVNNSYGVDFDSYDISSTLSSGDTSATTFYSTGQDRVLLTLQIISVTNTPVSDLAITKTHTGDFTVGQTGIFTIGVSNNGPLSEPGPIVVTDTLPAGLSFVSGTGTGWSCGAVGQDVTCTRTGALASGAGAADITLTVNVAAAAAPSVTNTATVAGTNFDNVTANDSTSDATTVLIPDLSTSIKAVVDLNGGDTNPGDTLRYTISINETGGIAAAGVSVTDTIDALLTGFNVVSIPGGATDSSTPGSGPLNVTGISVPANGSVTVVFDATVVGGANPGDAINNTAVVTNPATGVATNAVAPTIIVSASSIPSTGTKNLYPYFNTNTLSRVVPVANTDTPNINGAGTSILLPVTPATQSSLILGAGNIPVYLCMDRQSTGGTRNIDVALDYVATGPGGSTGVIGNQTLNGILGLNGFQVVIFNINLPADATLNANTAIRMTLTNQSPAGNNRVRLSSTANCGITSRIELNANTVINVDSVDAYDNSYASGLGIIQASYTPNTTIYARAVVSDPFGSFDINGANIEIIDADNNTVQPSTPMTLVNDSGVATRTYEYQYTIPGVVAEGNWTARVTANEGTEGTVSDLGIGTFLVGMPSISLLKLVSTISDPANVSNPKAIPGAIVEFQVTATNTGYGSADSGSVIISDPISSNLQLYLGNPANPIVFTPGSSGLTFSFIALGDGTDDIDFSNDGGSTFVTPVADGDGFDITSPAINYIRITPGGQFNGSTGSPDPSFTIRFRARVR